MAEGLRSALDGVESQREVQLAGALADHAAALEELRGDYEAQLARSQKLSEETLNAMRARNDEQTSLMEERHTAQVEALEREKEQIKEQHAAGWAHLPLPALLRSAIDDANAKLAEQHAAELSEIAKERRAEIDACVPRRRRSGARRRRRSRSSANSSNARPSSS